MNAHRAAFECRDPAELVGVRVAPGGGHAHIWGKRCAAVQPDCGARLEVGRDEQRQAGAFLEPVELGRLVQRGADRHQHAANVERIHPLLHPLEGVVVEGGVGPCDPGNDQLGDLVARRQTFEESVQSTAASSLGGNWAGCGEPVPGSRARRPTTKPLEARGT